MFKKLFITFCLYSLCAICLSQTISPQVLGSGGGSSAVNGYTIDYNIGEMAIQTAGNGPVITEGFEQPELGATPVPVQGLKLQVRNDKNYARLYFSTIQEFKTDHFIVERSVDGLVFDTVTVIKTKAPNGYSTTPLHYSYTDPQLIKATVYYRIAQIDQNGDHAYSSVESVSEQKQSGLKVFPNPAIDQIEVQIGSVAATTTVKVYSISGTLMYSQPISGKTQVTIQLDKWPSGIYILITDTQGVIRTTKFIKK